MPTKMLNPLVTIWWIDQTGTFNPLAPTAAQILADITSTKAINLSCAIATGYTLNPTDSDTDNSRTICDAANSESRGAANYEASLPFYMEADSADMTSIFRKAYDLFKVKGKKGHLVRRVGKLSTAVPAALDKVDIFSVMNDNARIEEADNNGPYRFVAPFLQQGFLDVNKALG